MGRHALLIGVVALALTACANGTDGASPPGSSPPSAAPSTSLSATEASSGGTFTDHGVSFDYSAAWRRLGSKGTAEFLGATWDVAVMPRAGELGYLEVVAFEGADPDLIASQLEAFAEGFFKFVEVEALGDRPVGGVTTTTIAGEPAFFARFRSEKMEQETRALVFAHGRNVYAVHLVMDQGSSDGDEAWRLFVSTFGFSAE